MASVRFSRMPDVIADHFPGMPIVPGVLLTEAMGQTGGWLLAATLGFSRWPLMVLIDRAKFRRLVTPDEEIRLTAELRSLSGDNFAIEAKAESGQQVVASATLGFRAFEFSLADPDRLRFDAWARQVFLDIGGVQLLSKSAVP